jgi:parallel beta-helix repeat protein
MLSVLWVDNVNPPPGGNYTTIQAAVSAANPGDTIKVAPGTYNESVSVTTNNLTILGGQPRLRTEHGASIVSDPTDSSADFELFANNVTVKGFTLTQSAAPVSGVEGIWTNFSYSGEQIINNIFTNDTFGLYLNSNGAQKDYVHGNTFVSNNAPGSASGNGIYSDQGLVNAEISNNFFTGDTNASIILVGGDFSVPGHSFASLSTQSNVRILSNTINHDSPIITVNTVNSVIDSNTITNPLQGDGIDLGGAVTNTEVAHNKLQGNPASSTGIDLFVSDDASGGIFAIAHLPNGSPVLNSGDKILDNKMSGWGTDGILLEDGTNGVLVSRNTVTGNGADGIGIEDSYSNQVLNNTVKTNFGNGIYLNDAQGNTVSNNTASSNGADGIDLVNGSTGNTISYNTANTNGGNGINLLDSNNNTVSYNTANKNVNDGILVEGTSTGNTIKRNTAKGNFNEDIEDLSSGVNTWLNNTAVKRNPATLG